MCIVWVKLVLYHAPKQLFFIQTKGGVRNKGTPVFVFVCVCVLTCRHLVQPWCSHGSKRVTSESGFFFVDLFFCVCAGEQMVLFCWGGSGFDLK